MAHSANAAPWRAWASALAQHGPPLDYVRLARIRAALAAGRYDINQAALAQALLKAWEHR